MPEETNLHDYNEALAELSLLLTKDGKKVSSIKEDGTYQIENLNFSVKNQKINGVLEIKDKNQLIHSINYNNGVQEGEAKIFFDNPEKSIIRMKYFYKGGILDGPFTCYYISGHKQAEGAFLNGNLNGNCKLFDEAGDLSYECGFKDGFENGKATAYFPKSVGGGISKTIIFKNGKKAEEELTYYPSGELYERRIYHDDGYLLYEPQRFTKKGDDMKVS